MSYAELQMATTQDSASPDPRIIPTHQPALADASGGESSPADDIGKKKLACLITTGLLALIGGVVAVTVGVKLDSTLAEAEGLRVAVIQSNCHRHRHLVFSLATGRAIVDALGNLL